MNPRISPVLLSLVCCLAGAAGCRGSASRLPPPEEPARGERAPVRLPRADERRGVWDHGGIGRGAGEWMKVCRELRRNGITDLFFNALWPDQAHYPSRLVPSSKTAVQQGNQLDHVLKAAHAQGLRVHLWKVCWKPRKLTPARKAALHRQGRMQVSADGGTLDWLCPSHPHNRRMEADTLREALRAYALDGIHLDYIRYPDAQACFCAGCRRRFHAETGRNVDDWPAAVLSGPARRAFLAWRREQITRLVRDAQAIARTAGRDVELSAAVYGWYPGVRDTLAQDWGAWLRDDLVDFVCPMTYTDDLAEFSAWVRTHLALPGARGRVLPGIGVTTAHSTLDAATARRQIQAARQLGAPGFVLFDLDPYLQTEILPRLDLGDAQGNGFDGV